MKPERADSAHREAGFGLVEVIIAMIVLAIGVLSVSNVLTQSVSMQTIAAQRSSALTIAQTEMERMRAMDPAAIAAVAATAVNERGGTTPCPCVFTRQVTVTAVSGNINEVTVIVTSPRSSPVRLVVWVYNPTV